MSMSPGFVHSGCVYMCLRAVQSRSERAAMVWVSLAALVNALAERAADCMAGLAGHGSVHALAAQEELARARAGGLSCVPGCFILAALHWLKQQPYILPVSPIPAELIWTS